MSGVRSVMVQSNNIFLAQQVEFCTYISPCVFSKKSFAAYAWLAGAAHWPTRTCGHWTTEIRQTFWWKNGNIIGPNGCRIFGIARMRLAPSINKMKKMFIPNPCWTKIRKQVVWWTRVFEGRHPQRQRVDRQSSLDIRQWSTVYICVWEALLSGGPLWKLWRTFCNLLILWFWGKPFWIWSFYLPEKSWKHLSSLRLLHSGFYHSFLHTMSPL